MLLNASSERNPINRPKSTVVGVESAWTVVEPLFNVMLLIVMLKETTEGKGASSPTTKTEPMLEPPPPPLDPEPALQLTRNAAIALSKTNATNFLMSHSNYCNGLNAEIVANTKVQTQRLSWDAVSLVTSDLGEVLVT
jgi:hypothetical protein